MHSLEPYQLSSMSDSISEQKDPPAPDQKTFLIQNISQETWKEIGRYILYVLCFASGVSFWSIIVSKLTILSCIVFAPLGDGIKISKLCAVFVVMGVLLFFFLLLVTIWHTLIYVSQRSLPYHIEAVSFTAMASVWLLLAILALIKAPSFIRASSTDVRSAIATAFLAAVFHSAIAILAFYQARSPDHLSSDSFVCRV